MTSPRRGIAPEDPSDLRRTAEALNRLTRETYDPDAGVSLDRVVQQAAAMLPSADWASVTTLRDGRFHTMASNNAVAIEIDRLQYELGTGPCVDAVLRDGLFVTGDMAHEPRWHPFGEQAHGRFGVNSMLALRLHLLDESETIAGLNFSSTSPHAFDQADIDRALVVATHCALLVTASHAQDKASNLLRALESNRVIGIAIGVLMAKHQLTSEQAFDTLRHSSQNLNRKLHDVAAEVVETGACPDGKGGKACRGQG